MTREEAIKEIKSWAIPSERGREVLEILIPELVESEDERVRRELIEFIQWSEDRGMTRHDFHQAKRPSEWIAYLEKQKEKGRNITANLLEDGITGVQRELIEFLANNIDASWIDVIKSADAYAQRIRSMVEKQKEQKPVKCELEDAFKYYTDAGITISFEDIVAKPKEQKPKPVFKVGDKIKLKSELNYPYREIVDIKNGAYYFDEAVYLPFDNQDSWEKKQKSVEIDEYEIIKKHITHDSLSSEVNKRLKECGWYVTEEPVKWEEEDQKSLNRAINICISDFGEDCQTAKFLKSLPKRFNLQSMQEWNEEDEKDIAHIIRILDDCYAYGKHDLSKTDHENLVNKLKSFHPQQKVEWNEEDEEIWFTLITFLKGYLQKYPPLCKDEETQVNRILNWLNTRVKSFRLHHRYKPSEGQMEALNTLNLHGDLSYVGQQNQLISLYQDLKKLM